MKYKLIFLGTIFSVFTNVYADTIGMTSTDGNTTSPSQTTTNTTVTTTTTTNNPDTPTPMDQDIITAIYQKFSHTQALIGTALTVTSLNGMVMINGTVTAQSQADAALEAAKAIANVKDVKTNIQVITNPELNKPVTVPNY